MSPPLPSPARGRGSQCPLPRPFPQGEGNKVLTPTLSPKREWELSVSAPHGWPSRFPLPAGEGQGEGTAKAAGIACSNWLFQTPQDWL
jgi:hypothetical protein